MSKEIQTAPLGGFMELLPQEQILFDFLKDSIRNVYESYGFIPLDTPTIERSEVLLSKAGGETEKQIYRFNKGDNDLSLRFDLTVPLARFVANNFRELAFPFRRYAIGKVFRGENPQKGRFREFYQCDIDVIGNENLTLSYDAELVAVINSVFKKINVGAITVRINNRKIISGLIESLDLAEKAIDILRIIDKLEKIGEDECGKLLLDIGVTAESGRKLFDFLKISGSNDEIISQLQNFACQNEQYKKGTSELAEVVRLIRLFEVPEESFVIDLSIARGLDYYTGTVYETKFNEYPKLGSICSGGRYDNLAENFSKQKLPGVGISIGLTRLFSQLIEAKIISGASKTKAEVLIVPFVENDKTPFEIANELRNAEISIPTEVYLSTQNIKKAFAYADKIGVAYVMVIGEEEIKKRVVTLKDMKTGDQKEIPQSEIAGYLSSLIK